MPSFRPIQRCWRARVAAGRPLSAGSGEGQRTGIASCIVSVENGSESGRPINARGCRVLVRRMPQRRDRRRRTDRSFGPMNRHPRGALHPAWLQLGDGLARSPPSSALHESFLVKGLLAREHEIGGAPDPVVGPMRCTPGEGALAPAAPIRCTPGAGAAAPMRCTPGAAGALAAAGAPPAPPCVCLYF